jgi:hypothetical protein
MKAAAGMTCSIGDEATGIACMPWCCWWWLITVGAIISTVGVPTISRDEADEAQLSAAWDPDAAEWEEPEAK